MHNKKYNWFYLALCCTIPMIFAVIPVIGPIVGILLLLTAILFCLKGFINVLTDNANDPLMREVRELDSYKGSFTFRQKKYIEYIGFDEYRGTDLGLYKEIKEYFKECDQEGNGNYFAGAINKKTGSRYQLRYGANGLYKAYLKNWDKFDK